MKKYELIWLTPKTSNSDGETIPTGKKIVVLPTDVENSLNRIELASFLYSKILYLKTADAVVRKV